MRSKVGIATCIGALTIVSACSNAPHNNVLLFGTDTKVALDISSAATQGGAPQITLGYRRSEAVWMPLVANIFNCTDGAGCSVQTATQEATEGTFKGKEIPVVLTGKDVSGGQGSDSYSVFASFGAKFSGEASAVDQTVGGNGGLAQFFATGIAAQRIASSGQLDSILKVATPEEAIANAASSNTQAAALGQSNRTKSDTIVSCVTQGSTFSPSQLQTLTAAATAADNTLASDTSKANALALVNASTSADGLRTRLAINSAVRDSVANAAQNQANCIS